MHSRLLLTVGALLMAAMAFGEDVTLPPRPARPLRPEVLDKSDATRAERDAAMAAWREDEKAWENALTPAQKAEMKRQEEQKEKERQESFERSKRLPVAADGYSWQEAASKRKIDAASIERLRRDKIAYGPSVKQSFVPYLGGPIFITSDSLLNAFHVLFEDTFREYELRQCSELRKNLELVFRHAHDNLAKSVFPPSDTAPAWRQVQFVMGPALCLLGSSIDLFDSDIRPEIQNEVAKIRAAKDVELPPWLTPADARLASIDYRACRPIGFYSADEKLGDYFRAVRWLQSVPFRGNRDVEVAAIGMLRTDHADYFHVYGQVLGDSATRGLPEARYDFPNVLSARFSSTWSAALFEMKRRLVCLGTPHAEWSNVVRDQMPPNADAFLRKLEYHVLPAYLTWDSAVFQNLSDQRLDPEGLAIAMLLGSPFARSHLEHLTPQQVQAAADRVNRSIAEESWREPSLYDDYLNVLRTLTIIPPDDAPAFMRGEPWQAKSTQTLLSGWAQMRHTFTLQSKCSNHYLGIETAPPGFVEPNPEFFSRMADLIERSRSLFDANRDHWDELASLTRKLEALAQKQLRRQLWSPDDEKFLRAYGERIARAMGYEGNSYEGAPNDDAPRWAEVHRDSLGDYSLAVAVGRPRIIYVLYPWNGMEILCQGSVMPYYEYHSKERLTDPEWKQLLDSPRAPAQPAWLQPFIQN